MTSSAYRFATVEDLQLSPALVLASSTTVGQALQWAFEREVSHWFTFRSTPLLYSPPLGVLRRWGTTAQLKKLTPFCGVPQTQFSILPISEPNTRNLVGWLSAEKLKEQVSRGEAQEELTLAELDSRGSSSVSKFARSKKYQGELLSCIPKRSRIRTDAFACSPNLHPLLLACPNESVITPDTPLEELDNFFKSTKSTFALVTDASRKFVLGVVTPEDLQK